jgi:hypothetical protein
MFDIAEKRQPCFGVCRHLKALGEMVSGEDGWLKIKQQNKKINNSQYFLIHFNFISGCRLIKQRMGMMCQHVIGVC